MSYEPTEWKAGDTVTSAKLNKIEQGIALNSSSNSGGSKILVVNCDNDTRTLDRTWNELAEADFAILPHVEEFNGVMSRYNLILDELIANPQYGFVAIFYSYNHQLTFVAATSDGYPVYTNALESDIPISDLDPGADSGEIQM